MTKPSLSKLSSWLLSKSTAVPKKKYYHLLLQEQIDKREEVIPELAEYVYEAHEPARQHIRNLLSDSLHPFKLKSKADPAFGYPEKLGPITLQGYFGEVFSGIVAENYKHFGSDRWEVPAYLFHTHDVAFQQLELAKQTGEAVKEVPGRTGDDCLAFERNDSGDIERIMFCESKCTQNHSADLIKKNHEKLSSANLMPVDLLRVVEALKTDEVNPLVQDWISALRRIIVGQTTLKERCDLSSYVCGMKPKTKQSWISQEDPNPGYTGGRSLESVEAHIGEIEKLVKAVYGKIGHSST